MVDNLIACELRKLKKKMFIVGNIMFYFHITFFLTG